MPNEGQNVPKSRISTLITKREQTLYSDLIAAESELKDHMETVVKLICSEMNYDFHDRFLTVTFSVFFPKGADKGTASEVRHAYYTSASLSTETEKTATVVAPSLSVKQDTMEYFYTRTLSASNKIREDFVAKKLEAYQLDMDVFEQDNGMTYKIYLIYNLGTQKKKS